MLSTGRIVVCLALLVSPAALAAPHEARVPLHDGRLESADLTAVLLNDLHIRGVSLDVGTIDLNGLGGATFVRAVDAALGDGCKIDVTPDALVLHFDPEKLPHSIDDAKQATRVFTATAAPAATARQHRHYGLLLPQEVDPRRTTVILVHGLDCDRTNWFPMSDRLIGEGYQVAYFTYPSDGPLEESAQLLARDMSALRDQFPDMTLDIVAHSMGGLVARRYVEGDAYAGGVKHLILLGTPNLGSHWAAYRMALEVQELETRVRDYDRQFPKQADLGDFIKDMTRVSQQLALREWKYQPGAPKRGDTYFELPIQMNFQGEFLNVYSFLSEVEHLQRLTRIRKLAIKAKDFKTGLVEVEIGLNIYFSEG